MKCHDHPETEAIGVCALCGHPLCGVCAREDEQSFYCAICRSDLFSAAVAVPGPAGGETAAGGGLPPPLVAAAPVRNAGTAAFLSVFFPFGGQVYNDQPAKAAAFLLLFAGCLVLTGRAHPLEGLFGGLATLLYGYQIYDAYRTARGRAGTEMAAFGGTDAVAAGSAEPGAAAHRQAAESPYWGLVLLLLGTVFLLDNLQVLPLEAAARLWPLLLIATGAALIHAFLRRAGRPLGGQRRQPGPRGAGRSPGTDDADL